MKTTTSSTHISSAFNALRSSIFFPILFSLLFLINGQHAKAQHLWYNDPKNGDIIMNEVMVTNTTPCSYWETMGWNNGGQGGAYCGIQQGSKGPNFIFSIWDPQGTSTPIAAPYQLQNSNVTKFGGEGTGLHYDDAALIGWKLNTWVRTVSRRWDYNGHSYFGFWSYDYGTNNWTHHVTMDFPVASVQFNSGGTNSFLEDWCSSPQNYRKGLYKNGYKRASGQWMPWNTAGYSGNGSSPGDAKANAGVENGAFFMEFGGNTSKKVTEGQKLTIPLPAAPTLTIGQLVSTVVNYKQDSLKVSWVTDKTKSPQFSYTIKVINSTGSVVITKTDRVPHLRALSFSVKNIPSGAYTVSVSMLDIFDQQSNEIVKPIVIGTNTGINDQSVTSISDFTIYPNPCKNLVSLSFNASEHPHVLLFMYDLTGRVVLSNVLLNADHSTLDISDQCNGIYFIKLYDQNTNAVQYIKLVKEEGF
jgi:hypothetical protein